MFFREQQFVIRINREKIGGEADEFERDFMSMDHDEFVNKYISEETEVLPTRYIKPSTHNYFDSNPVLCCKCHKLYGFPSNQFVFDLVTGKTYCAACNNEEDVKTEDRITLHLGSGMISYRKKYRQVVTEEIPAPYLPVDRDIVLEMDGLNKFLDVDLMSLTSMCLLSFDMEINEQWKEFRSDLIMEYAQEHEININ